VLLILSTLDLKYNRSEVQVHLEILEVEVGFVFSLQGQSLVPGLCVVSKCQEAAIGAQQQCCRLLWNKNTTISTSILHLSLFARGERTQGNLRVLNILGINSHDGDNNYCLNPHPSALLADQILVPWRKHD